MLHRLLIGAAVLIAPQAALADALEAKRGPGEIVAAAAAGDWRGVDPAQILVMELDAGRVVIELSDDFAQAHVAQAKTLAKAGYYDGLSFYRVIEGFVAQGGDPFAERALPEGAAAALTAEFDESPPAGVAPDAASKEDGYADIVGFHQGFPVGLTAPGDRAWLLHCTGAFAFGRENGRDTASTEFYITLQPLRYLDRNLTIVGRVLDGMTRVQAMTRLSPPSEKTDPRGDVIRRAYMGDAPPDGVAPPAYRVLRTDTPLFAEYLESRKNRPEAFFYYRPDHVDVCQTPIPTEAVAASSEEAR